MSDILTPSRMSSIRSKNTKPELAVQKMADELELRYELHREDLPGIPDLVFPTLHTIVFVHGCFWHMHYCPVGRVAPQTNAEFWRRKRWYNKKRDERNEDALRRQGWDVVTIWECETKDEQILRTLMNGIDPALPTQP